MTAAPPGPARRVGSGSGQLMPIPTTGARLPVRSGVVLSDNVTGGLL